MGLTVSCQLFKRASIEITLTYVYDYVHVKDKPTQRDLT